MINTNKSTKLDIKKSNINEENLKIITASIDLNENDFPRLFELNKNSDEFHPYRMVNFAYVDDDFVY